MINITVSPLLCDLNVPGVLARCLVTTDDDSPDSALLSPATAEVHNIVKTDQDGHLTHCHCLLDAR